MNIENHTFWLIIINLLIIQLITNFLKLILFKWVCLESPIWRLSVESHPAVRRALNYLHLPIKVLIFRWNFHTGNTFIAAKVIKNLGTTDVFALERVHGSRFKKHEGDSGIDNIDQNWPKEKIKNHCGLLKKFWPKTIVVVNQSLDLGIPRPAIWSVNTWLVSQDRYQSFHKPVLIHRIHREADGIHG